MDNNKLKYAAIGIGLIALIISANGLYNHNYFIGIGGVVICLFLIYFGFKIKPEPKKLSLYEVIKAYKLYLEEYFRISLPRDVKVYHFDESEKCYSIVLEYTNPEDNLTTYYPFEVNQYNGDFGRGAGQFLTDVRSVEFWIYKYDKTYKASEEIGKRISDKIGKKIKEELDGYYYGDGGEYNEQNRTTGG